ncbi:MAG: recombinase family protein [Firmicutes bacterium]|nr:recombinase family protein [Bacillota bacterium]
MLYAAAYLRMSTDKQEYSVESQQRLINDYAKRNGIIIVRNYIDEGISGRNAEKRPAFLEMIADSSKNMFEMVLIYDSSRFARNLEQSLVYKSILKRNGVKLISITEPILDDDTSLITDALLGAMNELYSVKLSKNVKRGMEEKALRGEYLSCAPFGYDRKIHNMPLVINEEERAIVEKIFDDIISGVSAYAIAKELNMMNIKTKRGNAVDKRMIVNIIQNPVYKGYLRWNSERGEIIKKADHAAIISEEKFETANKIIAENKRERADKPIETHKHYLIGLIRCKYCGTVFVYAKGYKGRGARFRCGGYGNGKCTVGTSIGVEYAQELILSALKPIFDENISEEIVISEQKEDIGAIDKKSAALKKTLKRAKDAYLSGVDTLEEYNAVKTAVLGEIEELERKRNMPVKPPKIVKITPEAAFEFLMGNGAVEDKNMIIRSVVEKIIFDGKNHSILIYLR